MSDEVIEMQKKAIELLENKGLSVGEGLMVRQAFINQYKDSYPFINIEHRKDQTYYYSTIDEISNLRFNSENEVILANAIYENIKDRFNPNEFIQMLKFTIRILGVDTVWGK